MKTAIFVLFFGRQRVEVDLIRPRRDLGLGDEWIWQDSSGVERRIHKP